MDLAEMLSHVREYLDDYTDIIDGDPDRLWSDDSIVRHLNQGARILCRRAWAIIEYGKAPAGIIVLQAGKVLYDLHPSVLKVLDATPSTQVAPLGRLTDIELRDPSPIGSDAFDVGENAARESTALTGASLAFASDAGTRQMRVYPEPTATQNGVVVSLKIARLPIVELTLDDVDAEAETPREWDMPLCDYAVGKSLMRPNLDTQSKSDGRELLATFMEDVRQARQERVRAELGTGRWAFSSTTAVLR